jgi:cytochrome b pre-mRNA-processing protein 3
LNPLSRLIPWRQAGTSAGKLYGAIVAQARLPVFYQGFGVPDTLEGRFLMLALNLFVVLHRLKAERASASGMAQELTDRFGADMETVLREIGVGDLSIPKRVRGLAASSAALLEDLDEALGEGDEALAAAIAQSLPPDPGLREAASRALAHYVREAVRALEAQSCAALAAGEVEFPRAIPGKELGDDWHDKGS